MNFLELITKAAAVYDAFATGGAKTAADKYLAAFAAVLAEIEGTPASTVPPT